MDFDELFLKVFYTLLAIGAVILLAVYEPVRLWVTLVIGQDILLISSVYTVGQEAQEQTPKKQPSRCGTGG